MDKVKDYTEEKAKCKDLVEELYGKVGGAIDIHSLTYAIYPKIVDWKTRTPLFKTVESWVTKIWNDNGWKKREEKNIPVVYGIIDGDKLVYIGKTVRGLDLRKYEHEQSNTNVGKYLHEHPNCQFVILANGLSDYEISLMEKRMIDVCRPKLNIEGNTESYHYALSNEGKKEKWSKYREFAEAIDDMGEFLDIWMLMREKQLWRCEEGLNQQVQQEFNFEIGIDDESLIEKMD